MLLAAAGQEYFPELFAEIAVIITYPHKAILNDISHKLLILGSTFYPS